MGSHQGTTSRGGQHRIGQVAKVSGLSRQTLHQYVLLGLIEPAGQSAGGHRFFATSVFRLLDEIRDLKRTMTLAEIREHFTTRRRGARRRRRS